MWIYTHHNFHSSERRDCFVSFFEESSSTFSKTPPILRCVGEDMLYATLQSRFLIDRAEKRFAHASLRHFRPRRRDLARKYRLEQHIAKETLDFAVKFRFVFRYETVVFRRYVLALLLVGLLRKFEAYLVYLTLIWGKFPRRYSCFPKIPPF